MNFTITPIVRILLIINVVVFIVQQIFPVFTDIFSFHSFGSSAFKPFQLVTYMFLHSTRDFGHIFGNMLGLFFFGPILEQHVLGSKRFLTLYLVSGIGAGVLYAGVNYWELAQIRKAIELYTQYPSPDSFVDFWFKYSPSFQHQLADFANQYEAHLKDHEYIQQSISYLNQFYEICIDHPMVGASGAIFGILMTFALIFPNKEMYLMFIPVPIKAKYFVGMYGLYEFYSGVQHRESEVAHFAHIGGMIFAFILVKWVWKLKQLY